MRNQCNEEKTPCPHLLLKRKPKCTRYHCGLSYSKYTIKGLGKFIVIEPAPICRITRDSFCDSLIDIDSHTCPGAGNPAMFAENCCADCPWYINKAN